MAPLTLVSQASIARLGQALGVADLDGRRFRMTITLAGPAAHDEDRWRGRELAIGGCRLRVGGPVPTLRGGHARSPTPATATIRC